MTTVSSKRVRCAIYTRVSTDQGLEQDFNSLDAQFDASRIDYERAERIRRGSGCDCTHLRCNQWADVCGGPDRKQWGDLPGSGLVAGRSRVVLQFFARLGSPVI